ncbi:CBO0543 family protein [Fredinandcohnia humi]
MLYLNGEIGETFKQYRPTFIFFILGDFVYLYMLSDYYPMWSYSHQGVDRELGITNTHVSLSIMAVKYPATILIFLGRYPETKSICKQAIYILFWSLLYVINEISDLFFGLKYSNGWHLGWSALFNIVMFTILRIHHVKPLRAWVASGFFVVFLWIIFDVPSSVFR